ncbi:MAG: phosphoribosylanthranilate isomerase [Deltaproteobacteria bacterium]|nr:phosphoribosylanthranilate isomerase [Deltaproteobacteria bacterium]MBI3293885.1 phosphoribosylanthranilate isomerase [Deltaproteobacteria bacterium]
MTRAFIQIAGALDREDAQTLITAGVDEVALPVGPHLKTPELSEETAAELFHFLKGRVFSRVITYSTKAHEVIALMKKLGTSRVQLHGKISGEEVSALRRAGEYHIIKSFAVGLTPKDALLAQVREYAPNVDGFLLDTYDPADGSTGATGKLHDWEISAEIVKMAGRPVILAGGLNENNVERAVRVVRPYGVDAHTGVESAGGRKDLCKVELFVERARLALEAR